MPSKDANGNWVYSQGEYEHLNFTGEPFSGFVEGIGYTCTETIVIGYPHNASGTHFMFDIKLISYSFDIGDLVYSNDSSITDYQKNSDTYPDRSDYLRIPNASKFEYDAWYNPLNVATFVDNVAIDLVNPIIDMVNGVVMSSQIGLNEGFDVWWENEKAGFQNMINAPVDYAVDIYNYATNTPASQQWSDLQRDISNPHVWESGVAVGLGLYTGGRVTGRVPQAIYIQYNDPQYIRVFEYYLKPLKEKGTGKLSGFTISKKARYGAQPRFDFEKIGGPSRKNSELTIPNFLKNKPLPHWHRGKGNNLRYHRPWEKGPDGKRRW